VSSTKDNDNERKKKARTKVKEQRVSEHLSHKRDRVVCFSSRKRGGSWGRVLPAVVTHTHTHN
jgi:hypothetical protein